MQHTHTDAPPLLPPTHLLSLLGSTSVTDTGTVTVPVLTAAATADRRELQEGREGEGEKGRLGLHLAANNWLFEEFTGGSVSVPLCRVATDVKRYVLGFHSRWGARQRRAAKAKVDILRLRGKTSHDV